MADTSSVFMHNGQLYTANNPYWSMFYTPGSEKSFQQAINLGRISPLGNITQSSAAPQSVARPQFTPNAATQAQLAGMNNMQTPQWMMDAYSNKIGKMGGNANLPPFAVTPSGFPGVGGKTAPANGTGTGG
jgi:hypothetical protein